MSESVDSASDERIVNNVMRHQYRILGPGEKQQMQALKDSGLQFIRQLHSIGNTLGVFDDYPRAHTLQISRELQIAQERIEEAVMWAVKHITR